jgi:hypothetical protein
MVANSATVFGSPGEGGGLYAYFSNPTFVDNIVSDNEGAGMFFDDFSGGGVAFCDFTNNIAGNFAGGSVPAGLGAIVTTNANGDPCDQFFNIFLNPQFVDSSNDDYSLHAGSPCIDAGDPNSPMDPDGTVADIGAFYFDQGILGDLNGDGCVDLSDLAQLLSEYGCTSNCGADLDGDGDTDLSDLAALLAAYGDGC